jgi:hypothetical protein
MCLAVYIASNQVLPLIAWDETSPAFYIGEFSADCGVKRQFTLPNVAYAGSNGGCGCGFSKDGEIGEELEVVRENYRQLASYITDLQARGASIQLFCSWEGDQTLEPEFNDTIRVSDLATNEFDFKDRTLYWVDAG